MDSDARFRIACCGRRFGKTKLARGEVVEFASENSDSLVWVVCPSHDDARELFFEPLLDMIPNALMEGSPKDQKETPPREINLTNGTRISFRSFDSKLRGRGVDLVVIDEAGEMPDSAADGALLPSLLDTKGDMLAIGTPHGRNWFHREYTRGQDPAVEDTASWQKTSYDNPYVDDEDIDREREKKPDRVFRQEYLAQWPDDEGDVFGRVRERNGRPYELDMVEGNAPYTTGVDLARTSNYTAAYTLDADGMLVAAFRRRSGSWSRMGELLLAHLEQYPGTAYLDATRDNKVIEDLERQARDTIIEPVRFTAQNKADMVENLAARLETQDIVLPDPESTNEAVQALYNELEAFTFETTPAGNVRYSAPEGAHDDTVDALALAAKEAQVAKMGW